MSASKMPWETKRYFRDEKGVIWPVDERGRSPHPGELVISECYTSIGVKPSGNKGWVWHSLWSSLNRLALATEPEAFLEVAEEVTKKSSTVTKRVDHYKYLEKHLPAFLAALDLDYSRYVGVIVADGDKCYSYKQAWEDAGIPFPHGVAIYLLGSTPIAQHLKGKVNWGAWVIDHYGQYMDFLEPVNPGDPDIQSWF